MSYRPKSHSLHSFVFGPELVEQIITLCKTGHDWQKYSRLLNYIFKHRTNFKQSHKLTIDQFITIFKKNNERAERIKETPYITDLSKFEVYLEYGAKEAYAEYCKKKTSVIANFPSEYKDSKSINFHVKKYGQIEGERLYKEQTENIKLKNNVCIEYWKNKGMTDEEAILAVSKRQSTFSLEKCIERDPENGEKIWLSRQQKWQNTLKSKSKEEQDLINSKKSNSLNSLIEKYGKETAEEKYKSMLENMIVPENKISINEVHRRVRDLVAVYGQCNYCFNLIKAHWFQLHGIFDIKDHLQETLNLDKMLWDNPAPIWIKKHKRINGTIITADNQGQRITLRSTLEYLFYTILRENTVKFEYGKRYDSSTLIYDFFLTDYRLYVEIGGYPNDKEYVKKMNMKRDKFGAVILWNPHEYRSFVEKLKP